MKTSSFSLPLLLLLSACTIAPSEETASSEAAQNEDPDEGVTDPDEGVGGTPNCGADCASTILPSCEARATVSGPIATPTPFGSFTTFDPGPIAPIGDRSFIFLDIPSTGTAEGTWMDVSPIGPNGLTGLTSVRPDPIKTAKYPRAFKSMSGKTVILFDDGGLGATTKAATFDGTTFGAPITTTCSYADVLNGGCEARAAGDGHIWVRHNNNLYEQVGAALQLRGGAPVGPRIFDVDSAGTVYAVGASASFNEVLVGWKLAVGAGGWSKLGALPKSRFDAVANQIEGGVQLDGIFGTLAPDGSIHLFSSARCIGEGDRNRNQIYIRSRDFREWEIEGLPSADNLYNGQVSWRHAAIVALDYQRVRTVVLSSPKPTFDGFAYSYPDRQYNLLLRCRNNDGRASFTRAGYARVPGWSERAFATFSSTGIATFLTRGGITQLH